MSFSEYDVDRHTKKSNFLKQLDLLINWDAISLEIQKYYTPKSDVIGRPAYLGILLFKMLLVGIWDKGLSDEAVEDMANANPHVMRFLGIRLEDHVPDHSVLSCFRTALTHAKAWDALFNSVNQQLERLNAKVPDDYHVDASVTISHRKPKGQPTYEVSSDRSDRDENRSARIKKRNTLITKNRFVAERTFGGQALWFGGKNLKYVGLDKAHGWHVMLAMAYNLKRLPALWVQYNFKPQQLRGA